MTGKNSEQTASPQLFEIKGGSISLPVLRLLSTDVEGIAASLAEKVRQAPEFFRHAPIVIDLQELSAKRVVSLDFGGLVQSLRDFGLIPVGVRGGSEKLHRSASDADLAVLADTKSEPAASAPVASKPVAVKAAPAPEPPTEAFNKLVDQPIRSGQRIYAAGGDLVVVNQVSAGAEIMADGNIHVYGPLRGRALAGVKGNLNSRIFCTDLQAELISVGGHYKISENLDESVRGKPVQIFLRDNALIIENI